MALSVLQPWVMELSLMQQSVLLTALRDPDTIQRLHPVNHVIKAIRRTVLLSAFDLRALDPYEKGGGSFTGPCTHIGGLSGIFHDAIKDYDDLPLHFLQHLIGAVEILGYCHPDMPIRTLWLTFYREWSAVLHMKPEPYEEMIVRLSSNYKEWKRRDRTE